MPDGQTAGTLATSCGRSRRQAGALRPTPYGVLGRRLSPCRGAVVRARSGARNRRYRMVRVTAGAQGISKRFVVSSRFAPFPGGVPQTGQAGADSVFPLCGGWARVVAFVPLASGHRSSRVPGGVAHPALALPVVLVVTGERFVASRVPDPIAVSTIITGTGNTLAGVMVHDASDRRKNEMGVSGRPQPLHGQVSDVLVDFGSWERRALSDGTIDHVEALEGVGILRELVTNVRPMVATAEHVATCMAGSQGMFSPRAIRGWNTAQGRMPANMIAFPVTRDRAAGD